MNIDEPRRHHLTRCIDNPQSLPAGTIPDRHDPSVTDRQIGPASRRAGAVDHLSASNQQIIHLIWSSIGPTTKSLRTCLSRVIHGFLRLQAQTLAEPVLVMLQ